MSDQALWKQVKQGDEQAFKKLFYQYYRLLISIAMRYVKDMNIARDLAQDVFLKMWEKRDQIHIKQTIKSYLSQAIRNSCLNHIKSRKTWLEIDESYPLVDSNSNIVEHMAKEELQAKINAAIDTLPPACRTIFMLRRIDGLSLKEIAGHLDISPKTVENQITKARKILARHLQSYLTLVLFLTIGDFFSCSVTLLIQ